MDPNAALAKMRALVSEVHERPADEDVFATMLDLAEQFGALDEWLSKGGFAPTAWGGATGTVEVSREVPNDEYKALVTIEATERLVNRARRALMPAAGDHDPEWAGILLEHAAEATTARTCTAVKSMTLSDQISLDADTLVAMQVEKAREVQRKVRERRYAAEDEARKA